MKDFLITKNKSVQVKNIFPINEIIDAIAENTNKSTLDIKIDYQYWSMGNKSFGLDWLAYAAGVHGYVFLLQMKYVAGNRIILPAQGITKKQLELIKEECAAGNIPASFMKVLESYKQQETNKTFVNLEVAEEE